MSAAETLRRAAGLMRERAEADGSRGWQVEDANEGTACHPLWMVTNDAFHNPPADEDEPWLAVEVHTGTRATAEHIASWHPAVALAVADWLKAVADVHWPKRHDTYSEAHYSAEPEHDYLNGDCDETCWRESYICNGCGTSACRPEVTDRALAVARAYLGEVPDA